METRPPLHPGPAAPSDALDTTRRIQTVATLLQGLDEAPVEKAVRAPVEQASPNRLAEVRLGVASSLFSALHAKHAASAAHCLRVALCCSSWGLKLDLTDEQRDEIEVAALLHDIGKIGVPDHVLLKPGKLSADEAELVEFHRQHGLAIISRCSASQQILDIVHYAPARFDGRKPGFDLKGDELPLGARMVAIADAFDSMTTDHVYRRALSRERAMVELFEHSGGQFDPALVRNFCELLSTGRLKFDAEVARRWLQEMHPEASNAMWCLGRMAGQGEQVTTKELFHGKLVDTMQEAVLFVDAHLRILLWNRAAERLTGISAEGAQQKHWVPDLIQMSDVNNAPLANEECPLAAAMRTGQQHVARYLIRGRIEKRVAVDAQVAPVLSRDGAALGATLILHDVTSQVSMEARLQSLHEKATRDPLTGVHNRAEFDRAHEQFVQTHLDRGLPCSLIICDIDFFKRINDTFGHPVGDEALIGFARLLQRYHRAGDLVARYGGEEFVMLCADCDNSAATRRAEQIRKELAETPQRCLGGKIMTASFGVTELQSGDTPETMLRRADRALLQAKDSGRNAVIQLGSGMTETPPPAPRRSWWSAWFRRGEPEQLLEQTLITAVPMNLAAQKLRGFIADHHAEIASLTPDNVVLHVDGQSPTLLRRSGDRALAFLMELKFEETRADDDAGGPTRTLIHVTLRPRRSRDRREQNVLDRSRQLLNSLKSYLFAHAFEADPARTQAAAAAPPKRGGFGMFGRGAKKGDDERYQGKKY